jgi:ribosomal protection tetracycline resistance protein
MSQKKLNLGILAHVDAGKTTLTERLLYTAGVIDQPGSVDAGTTQTDSLYLERQRGITIKSAVTSFPIGDVRVNLIDTPGHPDFIAEVERVLTVLDGAVLVISAVEGVQPQTRILMRTLKRLRIPTLLFVNKIDRPGADAERVLETISERLGLTIMPIGAVRSVGTLDASFEPSNAGEPAFRARLTEVVAERNDGILAAYVEDDEGVPYRRLRAELAAQTTRAIVHPVFFGSAITGAGVGALMAGIAELLPAAAGDADGPGTGTVFKIERGNSGEKIAYVRMFAGTLRTRDRLRFGVDREDKVTAIAVFERGSAVRRESVAAGEIGQIWGLGEVQIGDQVGRAGTNDTRHQFPPPTLESVIVARDRADRARLRVALGQIAEQDPLINLRQDDSRQETYVSLYGEVQKEVIQATLANDFGIEVTFRETTTIYIERPVGWGRAAEVLQADTHPFSATVGLRVEPAPSGSGIQFRLDVNQRDIPLYIYKTAGSFTDAMTVYVRQALQEGLYGWQVADCVVTMTECGYYIGDGQKKQILSTPRTTAADFRKLTPMVLLQALQHAGTVVCEPLSRVTLDIPTATMGSVLSALAQLGAVVEAPLVRGGLSVLQTVLPAAQVHGLQQRLPWLTSGEGVLESSFGGYQPVRGASPSRPKTNTDPLDRKEYIRSVL